MDNFFINMFKRREATSGVVTTTNPNAAENQPATTEASGSYEEKIVRVQRPDVALTVSAVYRAVELKSKTLGQMQMQYQRRNREGGNFVPAMWGDGKLMNYLIQKRANPLMTASELFQQMSIHREMNGNAFVYIERDDLDRPRYLWMALCGGYDPITGTYALTYNTDRGVRFRVEAPARDVIHWRNTFRHSDGYMGIPTHVYAMQTLSLIATQKSLALENAAKGGRIKGFIGEEKPATGASTLSSGLYNKKAGDNYARELSDKVYEQDITFLRGLDKWVPLSMSAAEMQMIEMLGMNMDDVARFYSTPRPLLMMDTNSHYTTPTNATMEYLQRTIAPLARELEDLFDTAFLNVGDFGDRRFHLCEMPLLRIDLEAQARVDQLHLQMGWTVNEIRQQYDMPALEKGDTPYVSTNLAELGSAKLSGEPQQPTEPEPTEPPKEGDEK